MAKQEDMEAITCDAARVGSFFEQPPVVCVKERASGKYLWVTYGAWSLGELAEPCLWDWEAFDNGEEGRAA